MYLNAQDEDRRGIGIIFQSDEAIDWSLILERQSFFYLVLAAVATLFFLMLRFAVAGYADSRLTMPRLHLREHMTRAGVALFSTPEIK